MNEEILLCEREEEREHDGREKIKLKKVNRTIVRSSEKIGIPAIGLLLVVHPIR